MFGGQRGFKDPDNFEIKVFVTIAFFGLISFYILGTYSFARRGRPRYEALARTIFDSGSGRVRFIWLPPKYMIRGRFRGYPAYFTTFSDGRRVGRQTMIEAPMGHDFVFRRGDRIRISEGIRRPLIPILRLHDFDALTLRSGRRSFFAYLSDGRPTVFGRNPGIHLRRTNLNLDPPGVRKDLDLLVRAVESGL